MTSAAAAPSPSYPPSSSSSSLGSFTRSFVGKTVDMMASVIERFSPKVERREDLGMKETRKHRQGEEGRKRVRFDGIPAGSIREEEEDGQHTKQTWPSFASVTTTQQRDGIVKIHRTLGMPSALRERPSKINSTPISVLHHIAPSASPPQQPRMPPPPPPPRRNYTFKPAPTPISNKNQSAMEHFRAHLLLHARDENEDDTVPYDADDFTSPGTRASRKSITAPLPPPPPSPIVVISRSSQQQSAPIVVVARRTQPVPFSGPSSSIQTLSFGSPSPAQLPPPPPLPPQSSPKTPITDLDLFSSHRLSLQQRDESLSALRSPRSNRPIPPPPPLPITITTTTPPYSVNTPAAAVSISKIDKSDDHGTTYEVIDLISPDHGENSPAMATATSTQHDSSELDPIREQVNQYRLQHITNLNPAPLTPAETRLMEWILDRNAPVLEYVTGPPLIALCREQILCLHEGEWLNDEVINATLTMLQRAVTPDDTLIWSTFFYSTLMQNGVYGFDNVRKWTKRRVVDVRTVKKILCPIHNHSHFFLAVMYPSQHVVECFDSLGVSATHGEVTRNLSRWYEEEMKQQGDEDGTSKTMMFDEPIEWRCVSRDDIPRQQNLVDCGVFTCAFATCLAFDQPVTFGQDDVQVLRGRMAANIAACRFE